MTASLADERLAEIREFIGDRHADPWRKGACAEELLDEVDRLHAALADKALVLEKYAQLRDELARVTAEMASVKAWRDAAESELAAFRAKDPRPLCFNCGAPCEACDQLAKVTAERDEARRLLRENGMLTCEALGAIAEWDADSSSQATAPGYEPPSKGPEEVAQAEAGRTCAVASGDDTVPAKKDRALKRGKMHGRLLSPEEAAEVRARLGIDAAPTTNPVDPKPPMVDLLTATREPTDHDIEVECILCGKRFISQRGHECTKGCA